MGRAEDDGEIELRARVLRQHLPASLHCMCLITEISFFHSDEFIYSCSAFFFIILFYYCLALSRGYSCYALAVKPTGASLQKQPAWENLAHVANRLHHAAWTHGKVCSKGLLAPVAKL